MLKYIVSAQNKLAMLRDRVVGDESGNAAEYGLIIGLVAVGIITALIFLAGSLSGLFNNVGAAVNVKVP